MKPLFPKLFKTEKEYFNPLVYVHIPTDTCTGSLDSFKLDSFKFQGQPTETRRRLSLILPIPSQH